MPHAVRAHLLGGKAWRRAKSAVVLSLLVLVASPNLSRSNEEVSVPRRHVLSGGVGVTLGGLGGRYIFRWNERGPAVSAGAGLFGYGLQLGFPVHRVQSKPTRELVLYGGVLRVHLNDFLGIPDLHTSRNEDGSHIWAIGIGPRLWPDQDSKVYIAVAGELMLSNEEDRWWTLAFEGGVGF